jgi:HSP20 family molecular chaperone IbpA
MTDTQVMKKEERLPETRQEAAVQKIQAPETDTIYVPEVDICEDHERVRLVANMPGVDQKSVTVAVEKGVLTIEGQAHVDVPAGCKLVGQEFGVGRFRRDFTLSDAVAIEGVKARVQQGVLEVTLPKREEVKTRKIKIEA